MNGFRFRLRERLADFREWIDKRDPVRFELVLLACLLLGVTVIVWTAFLPALRGFSVGKPAPHTIVARQAVTVLDVEATAQLKQQVAQLVEPVYQPDEQALSNATKELEDLFAQVDTLRPTVSVSSDSSGALKQLQQLAPSTVSSQTLQYLLTVDAGTYDLIQRQALGALKTVYADRITADTMDAAQQKLKSITGSLAGSAQTGQAVYEVAAGYIRPNQVLDQAQTLARQKAAMDNVAPVTRTVQNGDTVVQKGEIVTAQDMIVFSALGLTGSRSGWEVWLGIFLLVLLEVAIFSRLLYRFNRAAGFPNNMKLALVTLLLGFTLVARLLIIQPLSPYIIPVAALGMTVAVILNARSALLLVALTSLNIGLMTDLNMRYSIVALVVGALSLYLVSRVTQRAGLMAAGLATMGIAAFAIFAVELFTDAPPGGALKEAAWGLANGLISGTLTVLVLLILDTVFNLTTPLRLLELANPAQPLLKRLMQVAPGTYNHSIQMGNLAEAAAEAIGANPLLARVGAYYHDIGKTVRPEYFVENQIYVENPHNRLNPNLSKLAITAHVRDGEHLGRLYGLPQPVVDIIKQHHGTSVLSYFYHKALQNSKDAVYEESYRYEEQKPRSKEASIVMLADSVEAAARAMPNPTRRKLQGMIQEIVKQKIEDGQLDESELTQGDLHKIRESFDMSLRGLVGHRIAYPERNGQAERRRPSAGAPADRSPDRTHDGLRPEPLAGIDDTAEVVDDGADGVDHATDGES
jgi:cyclic-di-AMP phosphodiesterase PgpH